MDAMDGESAEWAPVLTFWPTLEEFSNLTKLMENMEAQGAHKAGIAIIKPPEEWVPRQNGYQLDDFNYEIPTPIHQTLSSSDYEGAYQATHKALPKLKVGEFSKLATKPIYLTPNHETYSQLEEIYWNELKSDTSESPIYGADVCDSITDPDQKVWNIRRLDSLLTEVLEEQIPGVNLPYLYFGMWKATFSWHVEDVDLYSVNFLHYGAPKTWYCVPPQYAYKLEAIAAEIFPSMASACPNLLRHKACMISPDVLEEFGLKVNKVVQEQRDMIVVFPHAYHSGFNHGFNIAESTNFAIKRWVEYGKRFRGCICGDRDNAVTVDMKDFVSRCQPERLEDWLAGLDFDLHPEDPIYLREAYHDAQKLLSPEELKRFQNDIKMKREIPLWYLQLHPDLEGRYKDCVDLLLDYDMSDMVADYPAPIHGPRIRAAKRKLLANLDNFSLKENKMTPLQVGIYMTRMKEYEQYKEDNEIVKSNKKPVKLAQVPHGFTLEAKLNSMKNDNKTCVKRHRFMPCTKCSGCRSSNCGECRFCLDMPRFGGPGVMKQKCITRVCNNPVKASCTFCKWDIS